MLWIARKKLSCPEKRGRFMTTLLLLDGHNDLPWAFRQLGTSLDRFDLSVKNDQLHTDIPRLRAGGVKAQFWSVYVPASTRRRGEALLTTLQQIDFVHDLVKTYPNDLELALTADDVERIVQAGKIASLIGMEGGHSIENSLSALRHLYRRGARYMTLTHSESLDWADSATDEQPHGGLTPFGEQVVAEMNRLGMLVDISHVSIPTMEDALEHSRALRSSFLIPRRAPLRITRGMSQTRSCDGFPKMAVW